MQRIAVVGTTGSGKTTLARWLAKRLGAPHIELDALNWERNWAQIPTEALRRRVSQAVAADRWVVDGNYSRVRDIVWARADTVIWLDYTLPVIMNRLFWRTLRRILSREMLWGKNRENFRAQFMSRDSLFLWALKSYGRRRRNYPVQFRRPEFAHLTKVRLHSPWATRVWLAGLPLAS